MKKKNLLLLSLVALSITACGKNPTSNSTTNGNSTSVVQSDKTSASTKKSDTSTKKTDTTTTTTTTSDTETGPKSDDYESSKWPTSVKDDMLQYLDNTLLPFIDLGITNVKSSWLSDTTTLQIVGKASTTAITSAEIDAAKKTYEKYGWDVTTDTTSMTATNSAKTITVKYYNNELANVLEAKYDEPFDESKAASSWPSTIVENMNINLNNHGGDIPYVYLGSVNPTYSWDDAHVTFKITGGKWDDKIPTLAKTAFEAANASIQNADYKWVIEEIDENIYGKTFNASIKFSDGTKLAVSIEAPDFENGKKAYMNIVYTKPFGGTSTEWPSDITDWEDEYTHNHTIPFFYCGTESDDINVTSTNSNTLRFYGEENSWDDRVIDNFKNAINTENTKISTDAEKWVITSKTSDSDESVTVWIATRTFSDGCSLSIQVQKDSSSNRADVLVTYEQGYIPTATDWNDDVKESFLDYLDGNTIPYIYLGQDVDWDWADWNNLNTLTIYGGNYFKALIEGSNKVLSATSGWTSSVVTKTGTSKYDGSTYTYDVVEAEHIIDATTGKKVNVTVKAEYYNYNTGEAYGRSIVEIVYYKPYIVPTDPSELQWNYVEGDEYCTANQITSFLGGHTLPFVYLNASDVEVITDSSENTIYLTGGLWDDKVLAHALTQISGSTQTTEENDDGETQSIVKATLTETDGCTIDITIHNVYDQIEYKAVLNEKYNSDSTGSWDSETAAKMSDGLNGKTLPFINLGATHPTVSTGSNFFKIETNVWNDEILTNAVSTINGVDGWVCIKNDFAENEVDAFKTFEDGSRVYFKINSLGNGAQLIAYYYAKKETTQTKNAWSDNDKKRILAITGTTEIPNIPFLYMGESDYSSTIVASKQFLYGTDYYINGMFEYYQKLVDAGYQKIGFNGSSITFNLTAEYTDANGNVTKLITQYYSYGTWSKRYTVSSLIITYTPATTAE